MGVSGSGKTTVGRLLAERIHGDFLDADDLHPVSNVRKMRAGTPLTDTDRWPWLDAVAKELVRATADHPRLVIACSALKRAYRDRLRAAAPVLQLVWLTGSEELLRSRLANRAGHFMPAGMLASQLADLEPPTADEAAIVADFSATTEEIVTHVILGMPRH